MEDKVNEYLMSLLEEDEISQDDYNLANKLYWLVADEIDQLSDEAREALITCLGDL